MAGAIKHVQAGQKLRISATAYNAMVDAAKDNRGRKPDNVIPRAEQRGRETILIQNNSGGSVPRFGVLGIDAPIILPSDNESEFANRIALSGVTPAAGTHEGQLVIILEPLADGHIGHGVAAGPCQVILDVVNESHKYADITDADSSMLTSCSSGSARILWHDVVGSSGGPVWAIVLLGAGAASGGEPFRFWRPLLHSTGITDEIMRPWPQGPSEDAIEGWSPVFAGYAARLIVWYDGEITAGSITVNVIRKKRSESAACPDTDEVQGAPEVTLTAASNTGSASAASDWFVDEDLICACVSTSNDLAVTGAEHLQAEIWYVPAAEAVAPPPPEQPEEPQVVLITTATHTTYISDIGTASASSEFNSSYRAWKAFDLDNADVYCWYSDFAASWWLKYQFAAPATVTSYDIVNRNWTYVASPKSWTLEGSNNGSSWTTLDTVTNDTNNTQGAVRTFTVDTPGSYTYYRLNITACNNTDGYLAIGEWTMTGTRP